MEKIKYDNDEIINNFSQKEKEDFFQDLLSMYFHKNFGSVSKADLELYLFSFYLNHLMREGKEYDDYTLSKDLGLTQSRIRSLKERKELKYPSGRDWRDEFLECAKYASFDVKSHLIKFAIPDVYIIKEVRNYFEKRHKYDEYQMNPKLFQCRADAFFEMGKCIAEEKNEEWEFSVNDENRIKQLLEREGLTDSEKSAIRNIFEISAEEGIKDLIVGGTKEILLEVLPAVIPGGKAAGVIYKIIMNTLKK